ncbi:hypothetical protein ES705_36107 [subsurface metagenome]
MTWVEIVEIFLVLVVGSFILGFVDTWWEKRKRDRRKKEKDL